MTGTDEGLAAALFEKYRQPLWRYLRFATGSADVADDLTQDVFVRVVRSADAYQPRERDRAWLFRIARNLMTDHARRLSTRHEHTHVAAEPIRSAIQPQRASIKEALGRLGDRERQAFLLCEIGGLSYEELSHVLDLTVPAVRSLLYRVRLELRATVLPPAGPVAAGSIKDTRNDF